MHKIDYASDSRDQLFESSDVARELDITPSMVRVYAAAGRLRAAVVTPRGARLFRRQDVLDFKRKHRRRRENPRQQLNGSAGNARVKYVPARCACEAGVLEDVDGAQCVDANVDAGAHRHHDHDQDLRKAQVRCDRIRPLGDRRG